MTSTAYIVLACFIGAAGPAAAQQSSTEQALPGLTLARSKSQAEPSPPKRNLNWNRIPPPTWRLPRMPDWLALAG